MDLTTLLAWLCSGQALHRVHPPQSWLSVAARKTAPPSGADARVLICLALISVSVRIVETRQQLKDATCTRTFMILTQTQKMSEYSLVMNCHTEGVNACKKR